MKVESGNKCEREICPSNILNILKFEEKDMEGQIHMKKLPTKIDRREKKKMEKKLVRGKARLATRCPECGEITYGVFLGGT